MIRSDAHGLLTGDIVAIHGVGGNTNANRSWQIRVRDADHFELVGSRGNAAFTAGGIIDAPRHAAPAAITAAVNQGTGGAVTVPAHGFVDGDQVTVTGLPGVTAPNNVGFVVRVDADNFRLGGMQFNAAYAGGAHGGRTGRRVELGILRERRSRDAARGLFRCTLCSDGGVVLSDNLMSHTGGPTVFGRVAFAQSHAAAPAAPCISPSRTAAGAAAYLSACSVPTTSAARGRISPAPPASPTRSRRTASGQSQYDLTLGVDPQDSTRVYAALQQLWISTEQRRELQYRGDAITLGGNQAAALIPDAFTVRAAIRPAPACSTGTITRWYSPRPPSGPGTRATPSGPAPSISAPTAASRAATTAATLT